MTKSKITVPIKAVIFDCDGTIVDSENAHYCAWKFALQNQGSDLTIEAYRLYVGNPAETISILLSKKLGKNCADEILKDKRAYFHELQSKGLPPIQDTVDLICKLANKKTNYGFKLGVASAAGKQEILVHLKHHGIEHLFDVIISGRDDLSEYNDPEGHNKPKPYIYLHAAKRLNVEPKECVVIEDSSTGVKAGVDAGCFTIAIPNSYSCYHDFSLAHLKLQSFASITVDQFLQMIIPKQPEKLAKL